MTMIYQHRTSCCSDCCLSSKTDMGDFDCNHPEGIQRGAYAFSTAPPAYCPLKNRPIMIGLKSAAEYIRGGLGPKK